MIEIYAGSYDGLLIVLRATASQIQKIRNLQISSNSLKALCLIDQNNQYLAAGGYDQEIRVLDTQFQAELTQTKQNKGQINQISKINEDFCAVGLDDGTIQIWNVKNWSVVKQTKIHKKAISSIFVSRDGKLMLTTGGKKLIVWDPINLKVSYEYKLQQQIDEVVVSADLSHIFITCNNSLVEINTQNNQQKKIISLAIGKKIQKILVVEGYIVMGNNQGDIQAWKIGYYEHKLKFKAHNNRIKCMKVIESDGFNYLIIATAAGEISIWDFIEFLGAVEEVSQDYNLEGLKPLCTLDLGTRIISLEAKNILPSIQKQEQQAQKVQNKQQKEEQQPQEEIQAPKTKKIKKKDKKKSKAQKGTSK